MILNLQLEVWALLNYSSTQEINESVFNLTFLNMTGYSPKLFRGCFMVVCETVKVKEKNCYFIKIVKWEFMKFVVSMKLNVRLLCLFQLHTRKKKSNKNYNKMSCTEVKRYISRYLAAWVAKQDTAKSCPLSKPGQPNNIRFTLFRLSKFSTVTFSHHSPACHICNIPKRNYK